MKIIGWERKGNVVAFYFGNDDLEDWSGDDWDNTPYEHNASTIPLWGAKAVAEVAFDVETSVLEPKDDYHYNRNSPFSMNDFKERRAPFLIIDPTGDEQCYSKAARNVDTIGIYMGDKFDDIDWDAIHGHIMHVRVQRPYGYKQVMPVNSFNN